MPLQILRAMRPHQWVKNLFVLAPLVFAERALFGQDFLRAAVAFGLFSALSGCVYILNDVVDVEGDRLHPTKRNRPIASGRLPLPLARFALSGILLGTVVASFLVSTDFAAIGLAYFTLNVGYSFSFKHVPFVDVMSIASGFLLRLLGGGVAIGVPITPWILGVTFVLALYLGLGKRKHELLQAGHRAGKQRKVLDRYRLAHVRHAMLASGFATVAAYTAYTVLGQHAGRLFHPQDLAWTIPSVAVGLWRFNQLTNRAEEGRSPTDLMLADKLFLANLAVWALIVVLVIYVP
ncbi:MAG: decaprenyl-phosphate phosphoribosyltransferase [Deltaproteobacteria bacterium HGW-Deltaproteobacteria-14]|jgi:4-hydroxybenzoate polyprenyltransferase|nr:MAG: decaprenyl-phosphate phosphoribosyltransferase [Deltaproteobacteria bacterium HGW-Deltaproteobacteria-14]